MQANTIYCADSIELLASWPEESVDLVFADPPFNIGYVYDKYRDDVPNEEYVQWSRDWMAACRRVLKAEGSFWVAIGDEFAADIRVIGRELGLHLRNWVIWHYTFGQNMKRKFSRAHTHLFYFSKDAKAFTFNDHLVRFPSARHTEYQDLRANPQGRMPDDVWDEFPRVCGTFKERAGFHGCQMPEALLMRIVQACSQPGELVLDPFVGSGTTVVAAKRLGRRYVGVDISDEYVKHTRKRLEGVEDESALKPSGDSWPQLHLDMLMQIYRETKVSAENLLPNEVAMRVVAGSLSARVGYAYEVEAVTAQLEALHAAGALPKLPNDTRFAARNHVKSEGKRYERRIKRWQPRRRRSGGEEGEIRRAM